jgi:hypothetical protein
LIGSAFLSVGGVGGAEDAWKASVAIQWRGRLLRVHEECYLRSGTSVLGILPLLLFTHYLFTLFIFIFIYFIHSLLNFLNWN